MREVLEILGTIEDEVDDPNEVATITQLFDQCETREQLLELGRRFSKEVKNHTENDVRVLRKVFSECDRALKLVRVVDAIEKQRIVGKGEQTGEMPDLRSAELLHADVRRDDSEMHSD